MSVTKEEMLEELELLIEASGLSPSDRSESIRRLIEWGRPKVSRRKIIDAFDEPSFNRIIAGENCAELLAYLEKQGVEIEEDADKP
jgi:hypothetical protein